MFKGGKFHGQGEYSWSNGAKYVGEHDLDQRTGFGTMIYPDGAEFSGIWENGVHVKFQDSPNPTAATTTTTTVRPETTTTVAEETTQQRRRKKVMRKKKGGRPRPGGSSTEEDSPKPKRRKRRKQRKQRKSRNGQLRRRKSQE